MRAVRGLGLGFSAFAASFALHIVGGATDQRWLFATAVALIFVTATGFPVIATVFGRFPNLRAPEARATAAIGAAAGYGFTVAALWAANGRAFASWEYPAGMALVAVGSGVLLIVWRGFVSGRRGSQATAGTA